MFPHVNSVAGNPVFKTTQPFATVALAGRDRQCLTVPECDSCMQHVRLIPGSWCFQSVFQSVLSILTATHNLTKRSCISGTALNAECILNAHEE